MSKSGPLSALKGSITQNRNYWNIIMLSTILSFEHSLAEVLFNVLDWTPGGTNRISAPPVFGQEFVRANRVPG